MGTPIRTAGMGITTDIAGTEVTTIIDTIDTDAITTRNSDPFDERAIAPREDLSWEVRVVVRDVQADMRTAIGHVCFTPKSGHVLCSNSCLLWANSGHCRLFDHFVGAGQQPRGHSEAECLRSLKIDNKFNLSRLLHRQIGWLRSF
jgi:hypothetical protein